MNHCLFCETNTGKCVDKAKWFHSNYGKTFDCAGSWSFGNDFARNVVIFGVDNSSSSLVLGEGPNNSSSGFAEQKFSINFSKENTKFCLSLHYNQDNSYLLVK